MRFSNKLTLFLLLLLPAQEWAQSVVELTVDGGYSTTMYNVPDGKRIGGIGYGVDVGYAYFFHPNVGLGLGAGFRHYAGGAQISGLLTYPKVVDTDFEPYDHFTFYDKWKEQQSLYYLEFPISLQFRVPLNKVDLWMAAGVNYSLALKGKTAAQGNLTHRGYYAKWDLTMDIPEHGFYSTSDFRPSSSINVHDVVALFARVDVGIPLAKRWQFLVGVNIHYALMSAFSTNGEAPLGYRNDCPNWSQAHYFMPDYVPLLNTAQVAGRACPLSLGLELGVRYVFRVHQRRAYPWRCLAY